MIYIDPPYNRGNDFIYEDDFTEPMLRYKEITSQATKSNPESMGRFHTAWLNMMYPRLRLAANLLRDDGVIFISIDDGEQANLRKICDEIFGEENFVANIMWQKKYSPSNDHKTICPLHDFVMVYRKSEAWQRNLLARSDENNSQYKFEDEGGIFRASDYTCNKTSQERPNLFYPIIHPKTGEEVWPKPSRVWAYSPEAHAENIKKGLLFWGRDGNAKVPSYKRYLSALHGGGGIVPSTWWTFEFAGHNDEAAKETNGLLENRVFSTPKPTRLIKRLLQLASNSDDNDIILDFFSGSATTAHAVIQLNAEDGGNRRFVMVQLPETTDEKSEAYRAGYKNIADIGKERVRRAGAKVLSEWQEGQQHMEVDEKSGYSAPDIGFRVFKLDTSNLRAWDGTPINDGNLQTLWDRFDEREKTIKSDRSDLDIVFEVMLKMGIHLDSVVTQLTVGGRKCYSIGEKPYEAKGDCIVLVCLDFGITPEDVTAMCDLDPTKIIAAEEAFEDSTAMSNAHYILRDRDIEMKLL
jgi:adenine-specific DNA-methyltransferase